MKILMDENLPHELRPLLMPMHDVFTVAFMGWGGVANGELLRRAATQGFDAIITLDRGYEHQQSLAVLPCSVVVMRSRSSRSFQREGAKPRREDEKQKTETEGGTLGARHSAFVSSDFWLRSSNFFPSFPRVFASSRLAV